MDGYLHINWVDWHKICYKHSSLPEQRKGFGRATDFSFIAISRLTFLVSEMDPTQHGHMPSTLVYDYMQLYAKLLA